MYVSFFQSETEKQYELGRLSSVIQNEYIFNNFFFDLKKKHLEISFEMLELNVFYLI